MDLKSISEIKFATHNSFSYLEPRTWWMKLGNFIAKCQDKTIEEQLKTVNYIDIRIGIKCYDDESDIFLCHGLVKYKIPKPYLNCVDFLVDKLKDRKGLVCRLVWDDTYDKSEKALSLFRDVYNEIKQRLPDIIIPPVYRKSIWLIIPEFGGEDVKVIEKHSSVDRDVFFLPLFPRMYATCFNLENIEEFSESSVVNDSYLMIDFIP